MNKREYSSGRIVKQALQDKLIESQTLHPRVWRRPARGPQLQMENSKKG